MSSANLDGVRQDISTRAKTDRMMSTAWVILPIAELVILVTLIVGSVYLLVATVGTVPVAPTNPTIPAEGIFAFAGVLVFFYLFVIVSVAIFAVLEYRMIRRRNEHFKRQQFLLEDVLKFLTGQAASKGLSQQFEPQASALERTLREIKSEEGEKSAVLWVILGVVTGIASLYIYYFLMKDFYRHERREEAFFQQLSVAASSIGVAIPFQNRLEPRPNRSFILYLVLTIVTVGIFGLYWFYTLLSDPNEHFASQAEIEDRLLQSLTASAPASQ